MSVFRRYGFLLSLFLVGTAARVTDYSHAKYIPIVEGEVLVWEEFSFVRHTANISEYDRMVKETIGLCDMFPQSHMKKLLSVDAAHLRDMVEALGVHHRVARSLDFLGTALKVVAGTPDASDFEQIRFTELQLVNSNNRQVAINTKVQEQINQLTSTVNTILKAAKKSQVDSGHLYETLLARNRMLLMEMQNLMLAVTLAKINIISPNILDHADLKSVWLDEPTGTSIADLMSVASVKVLQSTNALHFIIKFPKIKMACRKVMLYPVAHENAVLQIDDNVIAECGDQVLALKNCTSTPGGTFCQLSPNSSCARELHAGGSASCQMQPSHLDPITWVDDGILIINNRPATVCVDNGTEIWVHGTNLITFNKWARINETKYLNLNSVQSKFPGIAASPLLNVTGHQDVLSLPYLHRLNERNLEIIKEVKDEIGSVNSIVMAFWLGAVCCAIICAGIIYHRYRRNMVTAQNIREVIAEIGTAEGGLNLRGEQLTEVNTSANVI